MAPAILVEPDAGWLADDVKWNICDPEKLVQFRTTPLLLVATVVSGAWAGAKSVDAFSTPTLVVAPLNRSRVRPGLR